MLGPTKFVRDLTPYNLLYSLGARRHNDSEIFKLDYNEASIPPPPFVKKALISFLSQKNNINWYPDPVALELKRYVAKELSVSSEQLLLTNGSDAAHQLICDTFLEKSDHVIVPSPTYSNFFVWVKNRGAKIDFVDYDFRSSFPADRIIKRVSRKTRIIYLVNPFILTIPSKEILRIVQSCPNTYVLVDEAYSGFSNHLSVASSCSRYPNLLVTRSFSKALRFAGLRLGYVVGSKASIGWMSKIHNFKSVNALALTGGLAIAKNMSSATQYKKQIQMSKKLIMEELRKLRFEVLSTDSGFILFRHLFLKKEFVKKKLDQHNVFVRDLAKAGQIQDFLRMTIPSLLHTKKLLPKMQKIFAVRAVFLDRDGTLVQEPAGDTEPDKMILKTSQLHILPSVISGLKILQQKGYALFVLSNQDGISRGQISLEKYDEMNKIINSQFRRNGIEITSWNVCPHMPSDNCGCRKPKAGMIKKINREFTVSFEDSFVMGDRESDILLGKRVQAHPIQIMHNEERYANAKYSSLKAKNILVAAQMIPAAFKE